MNRLPKKTLSKHKRNLLISSAEHLKNIVWEKIEVKDSGIWIKTSYINEIQDRLLTLLFTKKLNNKFVLVGEVFSAFGKWSASLHINEDTWDDSIDKIEYYGENIGKLIDFK